MSTKSSKVPAFPAAGPQDVIEIQRLITIGTVRASEFGERPMVVQAFLMAGEYLNDRAGRDGEDDAVQFNYLGVTFRASCEGPQAETESPVIRSEDY